MRNLRRAIVGIDRHLNGAQPGQAEPEVEILEAIVQVDRHAIALFDTGRRQCVRSPVGAPIGLGLRYPLPAEIDERTLGRGLGLPRPNPRRDTVTQWQGVGETFGPAEGTRNTT